MKKLIALVLALVLALVCVLSLIGCGQQEATNPTQDNVENSQADNQPDSEQTTESDVSIPDFSYAEDRAIYVESEAGVKTSGFVNTTETEITFENVAEHAKNECTIEYDSVATYLDTTERIWMVLFFTEGMLGGDQAVYMDHTGKTVLIVYGE